MGQLLITTRAIIMLNNILLFLLVLVCQTLNAQVSVLSVPRVEPSNQSKDAIAISENIDRTPKAVFIMGQSNADGRAIDTDWPSNLRDSLEMEYWDYNQQNVVKSFAGWNTSNQAQARSADSTKNGLDIALNLYFPIIGNWSGLKITRGGSHITFFQLTANTINGINGYPNQVDSLLSRRPNIDLSKSFFIWNQGENEAFHTEGELDTTYEDELRRVYDEIRDITNTPNLYGITILTNDLLDNSNYPYTTGIREQQVKVSNEQSNVDYYDPSGLDLRDSVHFSADSFQEISKKLFASYYRRMYKRVLINKL